MSAEQTSEQVVQCANTGCTFWGRPSTGNFCSKCFQLKCKDDQQQQQQVAPMKEKDEKNGRKPEIENFEDETEKKMEEESADSCSTRTVVVPASVSVSAAPPVVPASSVSSAFASVSPATASTASVPSDSAATATATAATQNIVVAHENEKKSASETAEGNKEPDENPPKKKKKQKNRSRCFECRKKIGLTGIECRCGYVFCGVHRYADKHSCDFDYKSFDRTNLEKKNAKASFEKLEERL